MKDFKCPKCSFEGKNAQSKAMHMFRKHGIAKDTGHRKKVNYGEEEKVEENPNETLLASAIGYAWGKCESIITDVATRTDVPFSLVASRLGELIRASAQGGQRMGTTHRVYQLRGKTS